MASYDLPPDLPDHIETWQRYERRAVWARVLRNGSLHTDVVRRELEKLPAVSALDALEANAAAVNALVGRRWYVMQEAREAGVTWEDIGKALGVTKQGAQDYYRRQIAKQEEYVPEFHDAERARAALEEQDS